MSTIYATVLLLEIDLKQSKLCDLLNENEFVRNKR